MLEDIYILIAAPNYTLKNNQLHTEEQPITHWRTTNNTLKNNQ